MTQLQLDKGKLTYGAALDGLAKAKETLHRRAIVKVQSLEIKPNGRVNRALRVSFIQQISEIVEYIDVIIDVQTEVRKYMKENKLNNWDIIDSIVADTIIELILPAENFNKKIA